MLGLWFAAAWGGELGSPSTVAVYLGAVMLFSQSDLTICPGGVLTTVDFDVLITGDGGEFGSAPAVVDDDAGFFDKWLAIGAPGYSSDVGRTYVIQNTFASAVRNIAAVAAWDASDAPRRHLSFDSTDGAAGYASVADADVSFESDEHLSWALRVTGRSHRVERTSSSRRFAETTDPR
jgi:hypothetical protein